MYLDNLSVIKGQGKTVAFSLGLLPNTGFQKNPVVLRCHFWGSVNTL